MRLKKWHFWRCCLSTLQRQKWRVKSTTILRTLDNALEASSSFFKPSHHFTKSRSVLWTRHFVELSLFPPSSGESPQLEHGWFGNESWLDGHGWLACLWCWHWWVGRRQWRRSAHARAPVSGRLHHRPRRLQHQRIAREIASEAAQSECCAADPQIAISPVLFSGRHSRYFLYKLLFPPVFGMPCRLVGKVSLIFP